jgi:hypothetical protein
MSGGERGENAQNVKAMSVVGGDNDESVVVLANLLQVLDGRADRVVELEELAKRAVVVEDVHHLVFRESSEMIHPGT